MRLLQFHNDRNSPIEHNFALTTVEWIFDDLRLKKPSNFYLCGLKPDLDNQGEPIPGTARAGFGHDGEASSARNVMVAIERRNAYPEQWNVNPACGSGYLNDVIEFTDCYDLFVFLTAHELRHLWQWENPKAARQIRSLLRCNDETDADLYSARMLSKYRTS